MFDCSGGRREGEREREREIDISHYCSTLVMTYLNAAHIVRLATLEDAKHIFNVTLKLETLKIHRLQLSITYLKVLYVGSRLFSLRAVTTRV